MPSGSEAEGQQFKPDLGTVSPYSDCTTIGKKTSGCVDYRITIIYVYPKNTAVVVFGYILGPRHPAVVQVGLPRVAGGAAVHLQACPQGCPRPSQDPSSAESGKLGRPD